MIQGESHSAIPVHHAVQAVIQSPLGSGEFSLSMGTLPVRVAPPASVCLSVYLPVYLLAIQTYASAQGCEAALMLSTAIGVVTSDCKIVRRKRRRRGGGGGFY